MFFQAAFSDDERFSPITFLVEIKATKMPLIPKKGDKLTTSVHAFSGAFLICRLFALLDIVTPFLNQKEFLKYLQY